MEEAVESREILRRKMRAERSALAAAEVRAASEACCAHAQSLLHGVVALYSAIDNEIDPSHLHPRIRTLPFVLVAAELARTQQPLQRQTIEEILDVVVLPLIAK